MLGRNSIFLWFDSNLEINRKVNYFYKNRVFGVELRIKSFPDMCFIEPILM